MLSKEEEPNMKSMLLTGLFMLALTLSGCENAPAEAPILPEEDVAVKTAFSADTRIDGVMARVYKLSHSDSVELFRQKKVFVYAACL